MFAQLLRCLPPFPHMAAPNAQVGPQMALELEEDEFEALQVSGQLRRRWQQTDAATQALHAYLRVPAIALGVVKPSCGLRAGARAQAMPPHSSAGVATEFAGAPDGCESAPEVEEEGEEEGEEEAPGRDKHPLSSRASRSVALHGTDERSEMAWVPSPPTTPGSSRRRRLHIQRPLSRK